MSSAARACEVTLTDGNASATINPYTQAGLYQWLVDGRNVANKEWFWYRTGNSQELPLNTLSLLSLGQPDTSRLDLVYGNSQFNVRLQYTLTGGLPGSRTADIAETITINNTSCSALSLQFFQYSDFLNQIPGVDSLSLYKGALNKYVESYQIEGNVVCDTAFVGGALLAESGLGCSILDRLNDCSPSTFSDVATAGPGYTTWVGQWSVCLAKGDSLIISKDINISCVPEPSSFSLLALGIFGGAFLKRKTFPN